MTGKRLLAIVMVSMLVAGVPVAAAAYSLSGSLAVALHETGHALGLKHSSVANAVMNIHGPDNCDMFEHDLGLAFDDADGYRDRYLAIFDTVTSFNASAACFN